MMQDYRWIPSPVRVFWTRNFRKMASTSRGMHVVVTASLSGLPVKRGARKTIGAGDATPADFSVSFLAGGGMA